MTKVRFAALHAPYAWRFFVIRHCSFVIPSYMS